MSLRSVTTYLLCILVDTCKHLEGHSDTGCSSVGYKGDTATLVVGNCIGEFRTVPVIGGDKIRIMLYSKKGLV
jgi:hypothetical protein